MTNARKKFQIPIISMILLSLVLSFAAAPALAIHEQGHKELVTPTKSASEGSIKQGVGETVAKYAIGGLGAIGGALIGLIAHLTNLGGWFFDRALAFNLDLSSRIGAIRVGWTLSRNVANLFFILILLAIAIATILRVSAYQAKALLPKLIIIALLINFSLSIGLVVIDFSNILGMQFYNVITENQTKQVSAVIAQKTNLQSVYDTRDAVTAAQQTWRSKVFGFVANSVIGFSTAGLWNLFTTYKTDTVASAMTFTTLSWGNLILLSIMAFVFFVAGIMLLIRPIILSLLLVLAPIAFLFYILPDTEQHWKKWWSALISNSFFLPAFLFLLYVAIVFITQIAPGVIQGNLFDNADLVFTYLTSIVFLLAALILGRSMGVYGANTAMAWATTGRKWLTGAVGGVAARNLVAPIGARLQQTRAIGRITEASPTLGYYARLGTGWLAGLGRAPEQAENMARAALGQAESTWGPSFQKLNRAGKEAMLRNMTPEQRATFVNGLTGNQKTLAENILRSPQFSSAEQAKFNLEEFRRLPLNQQQARFATYDAQTQESILKGLNDEEKAKFIGSLEATNPALATSAENILKSRLNPKDYQNFKVARILNKPKSEQVAAWSQPDFTDDGKEAMLRKMKSDEDRAEFVDSLGVPGAPARASAESVISSRFTPKEQQGIKVAGILNKPKSEQVAAWSQPDFTDDGKEAMLRKMKSDEDRAEFVDSLGVPGAPARASAESVISSRFTPKEQQNFKIAGISRKPESEQLKSFATEFNNDDREVFLRKKDAKGQARFMDGFAKPAPTGVTPAAWAAAKTAAESTIQTRFSASEQRAYKEAAIENISQKSVDVIKAAAATMTDEDLGILVKVGDEGKVASVVNTLADRNKAKAIGKIVRDRGLENKYIDRLAPTQFIETIWNDPADARSRQEKLTDYFTKTDAKVLRRNLSLNIIRQQEFVEDVLGGATMEDISLMTGDRRRATAFKEGLEAAISGLGGVTDLQQRAQKLADEMKAKSNLAALKELQEYINKTSPYQDVITNILEGKPPPQQKTP